MADTLVGNKICKNCGTEIRRNAMFCYHCGGSVAPEVALTDKKADDGLMLNENISVKNNGDNSPPLKKPVLADKIDQPIPKPDLTGEPKLKSAAAMRRKPKNLQPKRAEIIWEEYENKSNGWFILVAVLLTLFVVGVLYLALRLR